MLTVEPCMHLVKPNLKCVSYELKKTLDEERQANAVRAQEILATAENPRFKAQEEITDICKELREIKRQDILKEKQRQKLRTNSHELRLLDAQIRSAKVTQQLVQQKYFVQQKGIDEKKFKQEEDRKWAQECERSKLLTAKEEEEARQKKIALCSELQKQMGEMQQKRLDDYEMCLKDREEMQKKLQRLAIDKQNEKMEAQRLKEKYKSEMMQFLEQKEACKQMEQMKNIDDYEARMAYFRERDELNKRVEKERKRLQAERQALSERIGKQLQSLKQERKQREDLLLTLLIEERKAKEDTRFRQGLDQRLRDRIKLRAELQNYCEEIKPQNEAYAKLNEQMVNDYQNDYLAERDRIAKQAEDLRRQRIMEHSKASLQIIEERRLQRAMDAAKNLEEFEHLLAMRKEEDLQIEEERQQMLRSLPRDLLHYLPPGVLRPSDREFL